MNRKILITGASRGIGNAIAERFAGERDELYLIGFRTVERLRMQAVQWEEKYHCVVHVDQVDVSDGEAFSEYLQTLPTLDILVNNAGISIVGLLSDMTLEEWNRVMATNLTSMFLGCKYVIPGMVRSQKGKIINISSVWGNVGASMEVAYSASKGGVNLLTKALAKELAPSHIAVNAIACGVIDTDMNACFSEEEKEELIREIPADRMGEAYEVAELVAQLVDSTDYLTGQIITLDGGWI